MWDVELQPLVERERVKTLGEAQNSREVACAQATSEQGGEGDWVRVGGRHESAILSYCCQSWSQVHLPSSLHMPRKQKKGGGIAAGGVDSEEGGLGHR